jgi:mannose-6-phosphate isomerase
MESEGLESVGLGPFRLAPWFSERPWGRRDLRPWYTDTGKTGPVGEAWLTGPQCAVETGEFAGRTLAQVEVEAGERLLGAGGKDLVGKDFLHKNGGAEFPLLVKLLFPREKLSVQVHPDDAMARELGQPRGKTECWYVLEAEAGATIALGVHEGVTVEAVRAAIAAGTLEELLEWVPVEAGEMVFVDAGTVHSIGPGVVLLETQQTSDATFRLYDYGRGRELHLEQGLRAMKMRTAAGKVRPRAMDGFVRLIEQKYFVVDRYDMAAGGEAIVPVDGAGCVVGLSGLATVVGEGREAVALPMGRAVVVPAGSRTVRVKSRAGASFVRCYTP